MSKYFDMTHKRQEVPIAGLRRPSAGVEEVLEVVRQKVRSGNGDAEDFNNHRLANCRNHPLPKWADQPVVFRNGEVLEAASEAYRMLRTRLMRLLKASGNRSIVLSSSMPSEGKTLTTLNLALCCAQIQGLNVLTIDADLRNRGLSRMLGEPSGPGLTQVLNRQADLDNAILSCDVPNLYFLGSGPNANYAPELFAGDRWKELIGLCAENFQMILVDAPPVLPLSDFELIAHGCDNILVVVRAHGASRELSKQAAQHIDQTKMLGIVFNSVDRYEHTAYNDKYYGTIQNK